MVSKSKTKASSSSKPRTPRTMEGTLLAFGRKVSNVVPRSHGSILVHCTDTGEEFALEGMGSEARVSRGQGDTPHQVEVRGPAAVLQAVAEGRQDPARALAAGGIRVRGDLPYLEAVLREMGLVECP